MLVTPLALVLSVFLAIMLVLGIYGVSVSPDVSRRVRCNGLRYTANPMLVLLTSLIALCHAFGPGPPGQMLAGSPKASYSFVPENGAASVSVCLTA